MGGVRKQNEVHRGVCEIFLQHVGGCMKKKLVKSKGVSEKKSQPEGGSLKKNPNTSNQELF